LDETSCSTAFPPNKTDGQQELKGKGKKNSMRSLDVTEGQKKRTLYRNPRDVEGKKETTQVYCLHQSRKIKGKPKREEP